MKNALCFLLCFVLLLLFCSCASNFPCNKLVSGSAEFSVDLLRACNAGSGNNIMISPASVMIALAMTANGAVGETQAEILKTVGGDLTLDELNTLLKSLLDGLPDDEKCSVKLADSIWFRNNENRLTVEKSFINNNKTVFNAESFSEPFDGSTLHKINNWTKEKTDGKIENILSEIPDEAVMYLINAIAFEAIWETSFDEKLTSQKSFNEQNGNITCCDFMAGVENTYFELAHAKGFVKDYTGGRYKFVAILPDEGTALSDFVSGLDAKTVSGIVDKAKTEDVEVYIPKFKVEYENELTEELKALGMELAFDSEKADFSAMAHSSVGNIFIGLVQHKS